MRNRQTLGDELDLPVGGLHLVHFRNAAYRIDAIELGVFPLT